MPSAIFSASGSAMPIARQSGSTADEQVTVGEKLGAPTDRWREGRPRGEDMRTSASPPALTSPTTFLFESCSFRSLFFDSFFIDCAVTPANSTNALLS